MRKLAALTLPVLVAIAACTTPEAEDGAASSDNAFTAGDYVQENDPHYWAPSTFEEFQTALQTFGVAPAPTLAPDDPLTIRLQAWLDRIDGVVRSDLERKNGAPLLAPKPIAKVLISRSTFNAWVTGVPTCIGAARGAVPAPENSAYVDRQQVQRFAGFLEGECLRPTTWTSDGFAKFWDADKPACTVTPTNDGVTVTGKTCTQGPALSAAPEQMMVAATGQYIQFTSDLLADVNETTLAVVAAHELGHYYRGHTTAKAQARYNFWYQRDAAQKKTPVPAKNSAELQAAYAEVVQGQKPAGGPSFASKYSARLRPLLLGGIAPLLTERKEANFVCAAARDALGPWTAELQQSEAPSEETRQAFLDFEAKLQKCAPKLGLSGDPNATSVSAGSVLFAGAKFRPGPKTKVSMTFGDNLGAFLARLEVSARDLDTKASKLLKRMRDNSIGLYTVEQEADDFAMELATKLGFSVDEVLGGWLDFMAAIDRVYLKSVTPEELATYYKSIGEHDAASCGALLKDGFLQDDGAGHRVPVTLSLGDLNEPHHTSCYRLWNLSREAGVHHYVPGPKQEALLPEWAGLQAEAAALTAAAPAPAPAPAAATAPAP
jgi:Peptidase family M48